MGAPGTVGASWPDWPGRCRREPPMPSAARIVETVAREAGLTPVVLRGAVRTAAAVDARHLAAVLMRETMALSLPEIGRRLGDRDHTTILYAVREWPARRARRGLYALEARVRVALGMGAAP